MCVLIFYTTFVCSISHYEKNWPRYDQKCILVSMYIGLYVYWSLCILVSMYIGLYVKRPLLLSGFNKTWTCSLDFRKIHNEPNLMKIRPVGAKLLHADGQTDKANGGLQQFCERA